MVGSDFKVKAKPTIIVSRFEVIEWKNEKIIEINESIRVKAKPIKKIIINFPFEVIQWKTQKDSLLEEK